MWFSRLLRLLTISCEMKYNLTEELQGRSYEAETGCIRSVFVI